MCLVPSCGPRAQPEPQCWPWSTPLDLKPAQTINESLLASFRRINCLRASEKEIAGENGGGLGSGEMRGY